MSAVRTAGLVAASILTLAIAAAGWPIVYCYVRNRLDEGKPRA